MTLSQLQADAGSFRRLAEQYWTGNLSPEAERLIEDRIPKEVLIGYRPIVEKE